MGAEPIEITEPPQHEAAHEEGHTCGCAHDEGEIVLDVREVPHAVRHGVVFGALDQLPAGQSLVLVAPHDPLPLLAQLEGRAPGVFAREYVSRAEGAVGIRLTKRADAAAPAAG